MQIYCNMKPLSHLPSKESRAMPLLDNPRHDAFAQARARGAHRRLGEAAKPKNNQLKQIIIDQTTFQSPTGSLPSACRQPARDLPKPAKNLPKTYPAPAPGLHPSDGRARTSLAYSCCVIRGAMGLISANRAPRSLHFHHGVHGGHRDERGCNEAPDPIHLASVSSVNSVVRFFFASSAGSRNNAGGPPSGRAPLSPLFNIPADFVLAPPLLNPDASFSTSPE